MVREGETCEEKKGGRTLREEWVKRKKKEKKMREKERK